ncbi:MAG: hypothetical protein ACKO2D_11130 [Chloroflexota bacterium]|jgi:hypothetical protein|nr:hypothetical protein [Chloroflexota bacterium]
MDVVSQALHVAAGAADAAVDSVVSLDFDLDLPAHRAAYAAAIAVLAAFGERPDGIAMPVPSRAEHQVGPSAVALLDAGPSLSPLDEALRTAYSAALDELSGDPARSIRVVADTFPHVLDVLRDGANIEGVAHVQYMRWSEAQRSVRTNLA